MNWTEVAMQRVAELDELLVEKLLGWLDVEQAAPSVAPKEPPLGAKAMIGFALRGDRSPRTTADWMKDLREGDAD